MKRTAAPSELSRLAAPLVRAFDGAWQRMHWWVAAMAVLYATSGVTVVKPDETAVVLRWGRLVGQTAATQQHGPGLLFAFPRPIDEVVRVQTKHVWQLAIGTLAPSNDFAAVGNVLDPLTVGYALSGDQNVVHVNMLAHYQVRDPTAWAFYGARAEDILRVEISAAMVRSLGEMGVDHVLSDQRKELVARATERAQAGLDSAHSGLALVSLELTDLAPPRALRDDFDAVQSAYIAAETQRKDAQAFAQDLVPRARAAANASIQTARADAASALGRARGDAEAFVTLDREYRMAPSVVRERLYRDAVEKAIAAAQSVRWVPPPAAGHYQGMRVLVTPDPVRSAPQAAPSQDASPPATLPSNDSEPSESSDSD
jgi:modulator of FtsH protease HflK